MKLVFVLPTTALCCTGVIGILSLITLAQSPSQQPTPATPDSANTQAQAEQPQRPYLGIVTLTIPPEIAQKFNQLNQQSNANPQMREGVLIVGVTPDTPATAAGLQQGDVIKEVDEQPVTRTDQVAQIVGKSSIGQLLSFTVQRGDQISTVPVRLGASKPIPTTHQSPIVPCAPIPLVPCNL